MFSGKVKWGYAAALLVSVVLFVGSSMAQGKAETLSGMVTDAMCGAKHNMKGMTDKQCAMACVKAGSKYALVVDDKVYELDGKQSDVEKYAGAKAKVTGTIDGDKINVTAVGKG